MPDERETPLSQGDTVLATRLRTDIGEQIEREIASLLRVPASEHDRLAGHITGLQDAIAMIDGTYQKINDPRSPKEAPGGN